MAARMQPLSNTDLSQAVLRELEQTPQLELRDLSVESDNGVVTVAGFVRSRAAKDAVERALAQVSGLRAIATDLEIKPLRERTDAEIAKEILRAFQSHTIMTADDVRVIVSKGRVRLEGSIRSQFEKLLAEAAAKGVRGLSDIENNIEVKPQPGSAVAPRDRSVTALQETELSNGDPWAETGSAEAG